MIRDFGAKNFYSFKEGFDVSFVLGKTCPSEISAGKELSNIICVKGANGSGKTNILKAIQFLSHFISNSFDYKPESLFNFDTYFLNKENAEFYVTFDFDNYIYRYEVELTMNEVVKETLFRKDKREIKVFERIKNKLEYCIKEFQDLKTIPKLRANVSIFSMARQFELTSVIEMCKYFSRCISNVRYSGLVNDTIHFDSLNKFLYDNNEYLQFVKETIVKFDPAIKDIYVRESDDQEEKKYTPWFVFDVDNAIDILPFGHQSSGTKSLYKQLCTYKAVLDTGALLTLDEFDINLHPHILPHLLDIFLDEEKNKRGAQLLFTTHNTDIMDFLGRHRTYLVNKEGTESYCYRLDEIPSDILRNDRPIVPAYNQGKIGGVPKI